MTLAEIKTVLRARKYAWLGRYPLYFVASDGCALSFEAVRSEWRQVVLAHLHNFKHDEWYISGVDINWEDPELYCAHTDERIESAYADN